MMGGSLRNEGALNAAINVQDGGVLTNLASDITPGAGGITLGGGAQLQEIAGQMYPSGGGHLLGFGDLCEDAGIVT